MSATPTSTPSATETAPPERGLYVFLEPLVRGRSVLDVASPMPASATFLTEARARSVALAPADAPKIDAADGAFDVVLCLGGLPEGADDIARHRLLADLARVLRPTGCCVVRVPHSAPRPGRGKLSGGISRTVFDELLRFHFTTVDIVAETRFRGVGFSVSGVEAVAVNEDMANLAASPSFHLALCTNGRERTWVLKESLWMSLGEAPPSPSADQEVAQLRRQCDELNAERDSLRETMMTADDQRDQRDAALSALRREAERHLRQISDDAAAIELASLDRDRALREVAAAAAATQALKAELRQREADILALETELSRLKKSSRRPA